MSGDEANGLGIQRLRTRDSNEQLVTPALSPIVEHEPEVTSRKPDLRTRQDGSEEPSNATKLSATSQHLFDDLKPAGQRNDETIGPGPRSNSLKLSPAQIQQLTSSPGSLPFRAVTPIPEDISPLQKASDLDEVAIVSDEPNLLLSPVSTRGDVSPVSPTPLAPAPALSDAEPVVTTATTTGATTRPSAARSSSSPVMRRKQSSNASRNPFAPSSDQSRPRRPNVAPLKINDNDTEETNGSLKPSVIRDTASPMPASVPLPPLSLATYLQLELSTDRPSALYIHRPASADFPYESSKVKFERLLNFLLLPPQLEQVLWFGALACLDAWLFTFTILPLRFLKAIGLLLQWWAQVIVTEAQDLSAFVYAGVGRLWRRRRRGSLSPTQSRRASIAQGVEPQPIPDVSDSASAADKDSSAPPLTSRTRKPFRSSTPRYHRRRTSAKPSGLLPNHKADILHGLLIIISCLILIRFDASRMYHSIRGQAAIKLYVIYNVLEVCDRLFSALGQDILECLFSKETLERKPDGRSKIIRPLWMFALALIYNVVHAAALFYQVITLNVAVNSYSNALLTLLMSNQFVEIKGSVFKKFEKENLFQLTCADVVERFQLWLMLLIIALRNIVELGGLSISSSSGSGSSTSGSHAANPNSTGLPTQGTSILPQAFTLIPQWSGQVLGPFLIVLGSEMLVDWLKHAYINKFNAVKPSLYGRYLDVLAKDYYSHAFADQNLTKRLGLPVLPLSCLFIRASVQTYHMFLATHMPLPVPSRGTSLSVESASAETSSPATRAALAHIDTIFRRALGRSTFGAGSSTAASSWLTWSFDDLIALGTMLMFFLVLFFILLALKLILGICLLSFARSRYKGMKERERASYDTNSRRLGGWGVVELDDEKKKWIYEGDDEGLARAREREQRSKDKAKSGEIKLDGVGRYMMAAKRIW